MEAGSAEKGKNRDKGEPPLRFYETHAETLVAKYEGARMESLQQRLIETFRNAHPLLELGSGSGRDAVFLLRHNIDVVATDGSPSMIQKALELHPELAGRYHHLVLPSMFPFDTNSFLGVFSIALLMHFSESELEQILREIQRILVPKGLFLFSIPLISPKKAASIWPHRRVFCRSEKDWEKLASTLGFQKLQAWLEEDSLGRPLKWLSLLWQNPPQNRKEL